MHLVFFVCFFNDFNSAYHELGSLFTFKTTRIEHLYEGNLSTECPTTLSSSDELVLRLEQMQALLKTEPEEAADEIVDIVTVTPPPKLKVKEEELEADTEPKFFVGPCMAAQFVNEAAQQVRNILN